MVVIEGRSSVKRGSVTTKRVLESGRTSDTAADEMSSTSPARTVMRRRRSKDVERQVDDLVSSATQANPKKQRKTGREEQRQGEPEATPTEQTSVVEEASECEESKQSDSSSNKTLELVDVARVLHGLTAMVAGLQPSMADSQDEVRDSRSGESQTDDAGGGASQSVAVMTGDKTNDGESVATVAAALQQLTGAMPNLQMPQSRSRQAERREQPSVEWVTVRQEIQRLAERVKTLQMQSRLDELHGPEKAEVYGGRYEQPTDASTTPSRYHNRSRERREVQRERGHVNHGEHGERRDDRRGQRETVRRRRRVDPSPPDDSSSADESRDEDRHRDNNRRSTGQSSSGDSSSSSSSSSSESEGEPKRRRRRRHREEHDQRERGRQRGRRGEEGHRRGRSPKRGKNVKDLKLPSFTPSPKVSVSTWIDRVDLALKGAAESGRGR